MEKTKVAKLKRDQTLWQDISTSKVRVKLGVIFFHMFSILQGPINECRIFNILDSKHLSD